MLCGVDQHVLSHACVPCESGKVNAEGDPADQSDTQCEVLIEANTTSTIANATMTGFQTELKVVLDLDCTSVDLDEVAQLVVNSFVLAGTLARDDINASSAVCGSVVVTALVKNPELASQARLAVTNNEIAVLIDGVRIELVNFDETTTIATAIMSASRGRGWVSNNTVGPGEHDSAESRATFYALAGVAFFAILICFTMVCHYAADDGDDDAELIDPESGEDRRTSHVYYYGMDQEEVAHEAAVLASGLAPLPPGAPTPANKVLFKGGGGLKSVIRGLMSLGILPTLYMLVSLFAFMYALFEYYVFGTFANRGFQYGMLSAVLLEYFLLVAPALLYGFHGLDYDDAKKLWKLGWAGKLAIFTLPITMVFSLVVAAAYMSYRAARTFNRKHLPPTWPYAVRGVVTVLAAPFVSVGVFAWISMLPVLWGASIGLKVYAFYPWLYDKLKKSFIGMVHNEKHRIDVPAFRFDSIWKEQDRRRVAKILELFHPESAEKEKAPNEGMTAGSAAFLMTYSLLLEFILCDAIGVILGTVNANSGAGWDLYTKGSVTMNAFAFVVSGYTILKMLCKPPYSLFNPSAFVGPERVPLTEEDPRHPKFTGANGWAIAKAKWGIAYRDNRDFSTLPKKSAHDWDAHHTEFTKVNKARKLSVEEKGAFGQAQGGPNLFSVTAAANAHANVKRESKRIRKASVKVLPNKDGAADYLAEYKRKRENKAAGLTVLPEAKGAVTINRAFIGTNGHQRTAEKAATFAEPSNHFYPGANEEATGRVPRASFIAGMANMKNTGLFE